MEVVLILIIILVLLVLSTCGRGKNPKAAALCGWNYAHRGLHGDGVPENSMEAFRKAKAHGYGIELDVHLLSDGKLAVIHDSALERTTGGAGNIEELTYEQMKELRLEGTDQQIPEFAEVLELFAGEAPLIIELKAAGENHAQLCQRVWSYLKDYRGVYCIESFDPRCVYWFKKHHPEIVRGQLTENYFKTPDSKLPAVLKFILQHQMLNFLTRPDFVAYRFSDRITFSNVLAEKLWGMQRVSWTLTTAEEYATATEEGWIPIFEDFLP